jgi:hypothetical protein
LNGEKSKVDVTDVTGTIIEMIFTKGSCGELLVMAIVPPVTWRKQQEKGEQ